MKTSLIQSSHKQTEGKRGKGGTEMTRRKITGLWSLVLALLVLSILTVSVSVAAQEPITGQPWETIGKPQIDGVGAIRSIAIVNPNTFFVAVSNRVTSGSGSSYILKTTDGGNSFAPVGNFDDANPNRPTGLSGNYSLAGATSLILKASPNYTKDQTIFLAVVFPVETPNQVFRSVDGGESFQLLGGVYFQTTEVIKAMAVNPAYTAASDCTVAVGTVNPTDRETGNLYLHTGLSWKKIKLGDDFSRGGLDIYDLVYLRPSFLVAVASPDTQSDYSFYEYRLRIINGSIQLPDSLPNRTRIEGLIQSWDETSQSFGIAFPRDWLAGTETDTNLIAYSTGENSGAIFRRTGTKAGYEKVYESYTAGFSQIAMQGDSLNGIAVAAGETAGEQVILARSQNGGRSWSLIPSGPRSGFDGSGKTVIGAVPGVLGLGTGGSRGGLFKSLNWGFTWRDAALYSGSYSGMADWLVIDEKNILVLMTVNFSEGAIFKTTDGGLTWQRVRRLSGNGFILKMSRFVASPAGADFTIYALLGATDNSSITGQLLRSEDSGSFWVAVADPSQTRTITTVGAANAEIVLAQMSTNSILYSSNGGVSWTVSNFSPPGQLVSMAISPNFLKDGTMAGMVKNTRQVFISRDKGVTWSLLGEAFPGSDAGGLTFSPNFQRDKLIYVTTKAGGIYHLADDGKVTDTTKWKQIISTASISNSYTIGSYQVYADPNQLGRPVMEDRALYAPAGNAIIVIDDITAMPVKWRLLPLIPPARSGADKISLEKVDGKVKVYAGGWLNICHLTDVLPGPAPTVTPTPEVTVEQALASIAGKWTVVWGFDAPSQTWIVYDLKAPQVVNTLKRLERGKGYWIKVTEAATLVYKTQSYKLWEGWNLIGWLGE